MSKEPQDQLVLSDTYREYAENETKLRLLVDLGHGDTEEADNLRASMETYELLTQDERVFLIERQNEWCRMANSVFAASLVFADAPVGPSRMEAASLLLSAVAQYREVASRKLQS